MPHTFTTSATMRDAAVVPSPTVKYKSIPPRGKSFSTVTVPVGRPSADKPDER